MQIDTLRWIDRYLGIPLCWIFIIHPSHRLYYPPETGTARAAEGFNYQALGNGQHGVGVPGVGRA